MERIRNKAVGLVLLAGVAAAAGAETLDLATAMARARENAPEVAAAQARGEAARAGVEEARGHRLPTVSLSESWIRTDSPADVFGLLLNQERFSFQEFTRSDPNDPDPLESATTRLEVSVPLYTGGEISTRIEQARHGAAAAAAEALRAADLAASEAGEAYVRLVQAREQVLLLERALAAVDAHVELARAYVEEGILVSSELLRAEVEASRLRDDLAAARGRAGVAASALSFQLGAELERSWEAEPLAEPVPIDRDLDTWLARSDERADLVAARQRVEAAAKEPEVVRARRLPRIGLSARYDLVDESLVGGDGDSHAVIARAAVDLFAGGRHRAAAEAARAEAVAARTEVEQMAAGIRLEVRDAYLRARIARERLATARAALESARETERILEERFRQGLVKTVDLLDATTARTEAETRETVARADAYLESLHLAVAAGVPPEQAIPVSTTFDGEDDR